MCTNGRDVLALTRHSSLKINNCNNLAPSRCAFADYPYLSAQGWLVERISVARVRPRTSKGITDLLLPHLLRFHSESPSKKLAPRDSGRAS